MLKLKTKILFLLLMSGSFIQAQSTNDSRTPFRFGVHASPAISYIASSNPTASTGAKVKFGFGLITEFNFAENYSFSTGVDYIFRGGELTVTDPDFLIADDPNYEGPIKTDYRSGFVHIPVMLKMRTRAFGYYTYFADFGGSINISTDEEVSFSPTEESLAESYIRAAGAMFSVGLGGEYDLGGQTALLVGIYYNRSLLDNLNPNAPGSITDNSYRFDYINLKLGVLF